MRFGCIIVLAILFSAEVCHINALDGGEDNGVPQTNRQLEDVDGQGHENVAVRKARQFGGPGFGGPGFGGPGFGGPGFGGPGFGGGFGGPGFGGGPVRERVRFRERVRVRQRVVNNGFGGGFFG